MKLFGMPSTRNSSRFPTWIEQRDNRTDPWPIAPYRIPTAYGRGTVRASRGDTEHAAAPGAACPRYVACRRSRRRRTELPSPAAVRELEDRTGCGALEGAGKQTVPENKPEDEQQHRTPNAQME